MTPEQVAAAMPDEAKLRKGRELNGKTLGNAGEHTAGERRFKAAYYYDERGLAQVSLSARPSDCDAVYQDLVAAHGSPYRISNQVVLKLFIWHDASANNRLRLMVSTGICDLHYERLDDYKAVDDAQAAKSR